MTKFYGFIHDSNYAKDQAKKWRSLGYSVKTKHFPEGTELTIEKKPILKRKRKH